MYALCMTSMKTLTLVPTVALTLMARTHASTKPHQGADAQDLKKVIPGVLLGLQSKNMAVVMTAVAFTALLRQHGAKRQL
jgi:hypothetical protein